MRRIMILILLVSSLTPVFPALDFPSAEIDPDPTRGQNHTLNLTFSPENVYRYEIGFSSNPVTAESESVGRIEGNEFKLETKQDSNGFYGSRTEGAYLYWKIMSSQTVKISVALESELMYDSAGTEDSGDDDRINWMIAWDGENPSSTYSNGNYEYDFDETKYVYLHTGESNTNDIDSVKLSMETERIGAEAIGNHYAQRYSANILVRVEAVS